MRLSSILAPVLLFSLVEAHRPSYGVQCQPDHCPCQNECVFLKRHHTCCERPASRGKKGRDHHICGPGKECCGKGCCREGWKCSTDGLCRPPGHGPSKGCTTFVTTIVKPITTITKPITTLTYGDGETTVVQDTTTTSGGAPPPGTTGVTTSELPGEPETTDGQSGVITTTNTLGETIITTNPVTSGPATTTSEGPSGTPGISEPITITNPGGQVTTILPPGPSTTEVVTNPDGQVTTLPDGQVTTILPPGGTEVPTGVVTTLPDGEVTTIFPPGTEPTTTGDDTVPTGVVTTLPDGQVTTILPPDTTTGEGNPPTGVVTTLPDGQVTTILPPGTEPTTTGDDNAPTGVVTTLPDGQVTTLPPGTEPTTTGDDNAPTGVVTTLPDGQVTTVFPPDTTTTGEDNAPTGVVTTLPDGQVTTIFPPETTTNVDDTPTGVVTTLPDGQVTTVFPPDTTTTGDDNVPTGVVTTLPDGQVTTVFPPETTTNVDDTPTGVVTTLPDGEVTTIFPPGTTTTGVDDTPTGVVTTLPDGQVTTIFPPETTTTGAGDTTTNDGGVITTLPDGQVTTIFPPGITTTDAGDTTTEDGGVVTTLPDGQITTIFPPATTTTDGGELPSGGVVTTLPDGQVTTIFPVPPGPTTTTEPPTTTTDVPPGGWIIPVTTPVDDPKPTDDGSVIPCSMWFFLICIRWDDFNIFGWEIVLPPGIYPPGPPPPFSIDPSALFTIDITGVLPEWPEFTIGPDRQPTFPPKPSNGPDGECETQTAELCATRTSFGVSVSGEVTTTTNTQVLSTCGTVYGCNVRDVSVTQTTSATETATGTPISHVVYPREGRNETLVDEIEAILVGLVDDSSKIYASDTTSLGLNFWRLPITIEQADELRKIEDVGSVMEECDNAAYPCWDPTIDLVYQADAPAQLTYVSWPESPRVLISELDNRYYFDDSSGRDVDVWVMDTGATADHPEFDLIRDRFDWVIKVPDWDGQSRQDDSYTDLDGNAILSSHGTSMLSLVAGKSLGVAKNINAHIARLPRKKRAGMGFTPEDYLETLSEVNDRMSGDGATASGVLLLAQMYQRQFFLRLKGDGSTAPLTIDGATFDESFGFEWRLHTLLQQIMDKGTIVVTGAGNVQSATIDGWPQNFGKNSGTLQLQDIIVVGAVTPGQPGDGGVLVYGSTDQAAGLPHVYAPGYDMQVADGNRQLWNDDKTEGIIRTGKGTSDASAMTAGLVANFLSLVRLGQLNNADGTAVANTPAGIRSYLLAKSWSRGQLPGADGTLDRNGICNALDLSKPACSWNPNPPSGDQRRQEDNSGGQCEIPLDPSTTTAGVTTTVAPPLTDLPTLTDIGTGIVTPSGSSCAETGTVTQCIPGSGGQSACVKNPTCVSWVNTMPPTTTEAPPPPVTTTEAPPIVTEPPVTPLELKPVVCVDENTLPGHGDINGDTQGNLADVFCEVEPLDNGVSDMGPGDQPLERLREANDEIHYYYSISWVDGCVTTVDRQDVLAPIGDGGASCKDILISTYNNCNNGGVGGYIDAGCLRYQFIGGQ